jgi:TonB family protein
MLAILVLSLVAFQSTPRVNGSGPYPARNAVTAPVPISKPQPAYTDQARDKGAAGEVRLKCVVDEKGVPTTITVVKSLEESLDKSAVETVSKWRFKPGMKDGKPVAATVLIDVSFHPL